MKQIFDEFLNKKINPKELIAKINKITNYISIDRYQLDQIESLIEDIKYIADTKDGQEQYELILTRFSQYLAKKN